MRRWIEHQVDRLFPGMGWRPLWLSASATWLMVLYHHHGGTTEAPEWFITRCVAWTGIPIIELHQHLWAHLSAVVLLMLIPLLLCFVAEGWTPRDLGFRVKGALPELAVAIGLWLAVVPFVWMVHDMGNFRVVYPRLRAADTSMELYFLFEGLYLVKWIAWEFFFRGFMLFGFQKDFMRRSVLISTIPFALMHYGKPELEMASAVIAGLVLCFIALRSRSIWPGVLLHWLVASTMDLFASSWWR
ncbi:MAG: CPBP family intramembrane metalloprotease [Myxococcales bacterium]|nr:CPBP family intramembrane metalloprotease [Myxococcales bacterium]